MSDPHLIRLPDLGEGLTGAEVVRWLVGSGDSVSRDQPLVEVETDKAVVQIPSPVAGTVTGLLVAEGAQASVGDALAEIVAERDGNRAGPRALPRVRALASELGVDLAALRPDGEIVDRGGRSRGRAGRRRRASTRDGERVPLEGYAARSPSTWARRRPSRP